jgi:hypothetical protein
MSNDQHYWFPAKRYGWGWGLPSSWQGWVVLVPWLGAFAVGSILLRPHHVVLFVAFVVGMVGALVLVCYLKGEPPTWRWGIRQQ